MPGIADIDKNLKIETNIQREGLIFKNALDEPFKIYGVFHDGEGYRRLPRDVAENTSPGVNYHARCTAGGRVRFITDSPYIVIKAVIPYNVKYSHMSHSAHSGFDMYILDGEEHQFIESFIPPYDFDGSYDGVCDFSDAGTEHFITLNFPLYNEVTDLYIGIKEGSTLKEAPEYKYNLPVVYYGSSITQGGCASRPGSCYTAILSRKYDVDHINLGFSGNGRGEEIIADYVASLDMSVFVLDYDHNSPSVEHYEKTHERFYKTVRAAHPDIPVIFMTRPKLRLTEDERQRIEIAKKTYDGAKARGEWVYFIPGYELFEISGNDGTVDGLHPSDVGFFSMASRVSKEFDKIFKK